MNIEWNASNILIGIAVAVWGLIAIYIFFLESGLDKISKTRTTNTQHSFIKNWRHDSDYLESISFEKEKRAEHIIKTVKMHDYFLEIYKLNKKIKPYLGKDLIDILQRHIILITINELDFESSLMKELNHVLEETLNNYIQYDIIINVEGGNVLSKKNLYVEALIDPIEDFIRDTYYREKNRWEYNAIHNDNEIFELVSIRDYKKKIALIMYMKENNINDKFITSNSFVDLRGGSYND